MTVWVSVCLCDGGGFQTHENNHTNDVAKTEKKNRRRRKREEWKRKRIVCQCKYSGRSGNTPPKTERKSKTLHFNHINVSRLSGIIWPARKIRGRKISEKTENLIIFFFLRRDKVVFCCTGEPNSKEQLHQNDYTKCERIESESATITLADEWFGNDRHSVRVPFALSLEECNGFDIKIPTARTRVRYWQIFVLFEPSGVRVTRTHQQQRIWRVVFFFSLLL